MPKRFFGTFTLAAILLLEIAPVAAQPAPLKGTVCFANLQRDSEQGSISCKGLGKFASVAEIYDRGYRVVSSGVLPSSGPGTAFLIIEERK